MQIILSLFKFLLHIFNFQFAHLVSQLLFFLFWKHKNVIFLKFLLLHFVFLAFCHRKPNRNSIISFSLPFRTFFIFSHRSFIFSFKSISSSIFISSFSITSSRVISLSSLSFPIGSFKYTSAPKFFCAS